MAADTFDAADTFLSLFSDLQSSSAHAISIAESKRRGLPRSSETLDLTYGDVSFEAMRRGLEATSPPAHGTFFDLGSGSGRAVIAAALLHELSRCVGVEILQDLHAKASAVARRYDVAMRAALPHHCSIEMRRGDLFDVKDLDSADIVFVCCVTWDSAIMLRLAHKLASTLHAGAKVLTVGKPLPAAVTAPHAHVTVRYDEVWHGVADCEWGPEAMVVHEVVRVPSLDAVASTTPGTLSPTMATVDEHVASVVIKRRWRCSVS